MGVGEQSTGMHHGELLENRFCVGKDGTWDDGSLLQGLLPQLLMPSHSDLILQKSGQVCCGLYTLVQ